MLCSVGCRTFVVDGAASRPSCTTVARASVGLVKPGGCTPRTPALPPTLAVQAGLWLLVAGGVLLGLVVDDPQDLDEAECCSEPS
jgi:hypothetical protein